MTHEQGILALVWEHLLPAMSSKPLADDPAAQARLRDRLARLVLRGPEGNASSPRAAGSGRTYVFPPEDEDDGGAPAVT